MNYLETLIYQFRRLQKTEDLQVNIIFQKYSKPKTNKLPVNTAKTIITGYKIYRIEEKFQCGI